MNRFEELSPALNELGEILTTAISEELISQGHRATGQLIESIHYQIVQLLNGVELQVIYLDYGKWLENGRRPGTKKVPLSALMDWIRVKGIATIEKDVKRIAFMIQRKIFVEGSPTRGSYEFSTNGRRKEFQLQVLKDNESIIIQKIQTMMEDVFRLSIEGMVSELKRAA